MRILFAICRCLVMLALLVFGFWLANYIVGLLLTDAKKIKPEFYIGNQTHAEPYHAPPPVEWLQPASVLPNCGLPLLCPHLHVAISVSTHPQRAPLICAAGKLVLPVNNSSRSRGINVVVLDHTTLQPVQAHRFDTYEHDGARLATFLKGLGQRQLLVMLTHDEAARNLKPGTRALIAALGSGQIQNLGYRDQWFMVGQQGMTGLTPYEQLLSRTKAASTGLSAALCVPRDIEGLQIQADPSLSPNAARAAFCRSRPHLTHFCAGPVMRDPVAACPAPVSGSLAASPALSSPVVVLAGSDLPSLALTLETVAVQPGLLPKLVVVVADPALVPDAEQLSRLFSFSYLPLPNISWPEVLEVSLQRVAKLFPSSEYVMVLEEGLLLSPDYLPFISSALPLLSDPGAMAVSAWNPNGYSGVNSRSEVVVRLSEGPGLAFAVSWSTVRKHLLGNLRTCCTSRGWQGWRSWVAGGWVVAPEVSRVLMRPGSPHLNRTDPSVRQLFRRLRRTSLSLNEVRGAEELRGDRYQRLLTALVNAATPLHYTSDEVRQCAAGDLTLPLPPPSNASESGVGGSAVAVAYKERTADRWDGLALFSRCFGLYDPGQDGPPKGLYQGHVRFSFGGREVVLVSDRSPLFEEGFLARHALTLP